MSKPLPIIAEPVIGIFGETVNVNDTVMCLTTSKSASLYKGKYLGFIRGSGRYAIRAKVEINSTRSAYFKHDGTQYDWRKDYDSKTYSDVCKTLVVKEISYTYVKTLNLNRIITLKE